MTITPREAGAVSACVAFVLRQSTQKWEPVIAVQAYAGTSGVSAFVDLDGNKIERNEVRYFKLNTHFGCFQAPLEVLHQHCGESR